MLSRDDVQAWLDAYLAAWRSYDEAAIARLFAPEATYAYHPYDEPVRGAAAIAAAWLADRDEPGSWEAAYAPALIEGRRAIATGETRYRARTGLLQPLRARVRRGRPLLALRRVVRRAPGRLSGAPSHTARPGTVAPA